MTGKEICLSTIIIILHSRRAELEKFEVIFFNGRVVQLVRTLACHARGRQFEPDPGRHYASVAQSVEHLTFNQVVPGSNPGTLSRSFFIVFAKENGFFAYDETDKNWDILI